MTDTFEKLRAMNVIWDYAGDYSIFPKNYYPMDENYKNIIEGFKFKNFRLDLFSSFFSYLKKDNPFFEEFKNISLLLLDDLAFRKLKERNLVIEDLRKSYANFILNKYRYKKETENVFEQIEKAYYEKVFGRTIKEGKIVRDFYKELFSINTYKSPEIIKDLDVLFKKYFLFERFEQYNELFDQMIEEEKPKNFDKEDLDDSEIEKNINDQFEIQSAEFNGYIYFEEKKKDTNKDIFIFEGDDKKNKREDNFIEDFYGKLSISKKRQELLERELAKGIHKGKKLYFTNGEYTDSPNARFNQKIRKKQSDKNKKYIEINLSINNRAINELKRTIENSLSNYEEDELYRKNYGLLDSINVWKAEILNDSKIFFSNNKDPKPKFQIDLLIDGSASQIKRQEVVADQAYIIASAMDKVNIPIRIMSFSTLRDYTVFNLYRDYKDKGKNDKIFNFFASGSNRDGLAFKTIHKLINENMDENVRKILIILSDGRPNDEKHNINNVNAKIKDQYIEKKAVDDTAKEIRKLKSDRISVLGVFTGEDEDIENAKLIYGTDFCRITKLENFSKVVSIYMKNIMTN
ncbi:VWA domain-containing protein [Anaerococcus porci]|uniref:VWA domain-containing protein n=1 Tax=Anaerococcus porci TaxID=2652269 RepID=UPI002A74D84E|nr:VWA domain-containing protein [Anaerococcus porci]MDY3005440.1 VWA domain-containing protein [Anaerococcus porci]